MSLPDADVIGPLFDLWDEILGLPSANGQTAVIDLGTGWAATLAAVDAATASRPMRPGGASIAGHTAHAAAYLEAFEERFHGRGTPTAGPETFEPSEVDEARWAHLRERLLGDAERVRALLHGATQWPQEQVRGAVANLAHLAYHLGAIRQMLRYSRR